MIQKLKYKNYNKKILKILWIILMIQKKKRKFLMHIMN